MDLKEEHILGESIKNHWYYISKGRALRSILGSIRTDQVLDVGAGSGIFSRQLLDHDFARRAVCVDPNYAVEKNETHNGKPLSFVKRATTENAGLVLMMDVLEHVPDDAALLRDYSKDLKSGSYVLITVPAFPFLWSGHDVFLEHYRRYTKSTLLETVRAAEMEPVKLRFFFGLLFPLIALIRITKGLLVRRKTLEPKSDLKVFPLWLNALLIKIHDLERLTFFPVNGLAGLSLFCLCRKP